MQERWPKICEFFGLVGVPPGQAPDLTYVSREDFARMNAENRESLEKEMKVSLPAVTLMDSTFAFLEAPNFDRHLSLERARRFGFEEERSPMECWTTAFARYHAAKMCYVAAK